MEAPAFDAPHVSPWRWYLLVIFNRYAQFSGRARRAEYWWFNLFNMLIQVALAAPFWVKLGGMPHSPATAAADGWVLLWVAPQYIYSLAVFVPSLAVTVRRLHDIGRSGWWLAFSLVPLVGPITIFVFSILGSQDGMNEYGPDPLQSD